MLYPSHAIRNEKTRRFSQFSMLTLLQFGSHVSRVWTRWTHEYLHFNPFPFILRLWPQNMRRSKDVGYLHIWWCGIEPNRPCYQPRSQPSLWCKTLATSIWEPLRQTGNSHGPYRINEHKSVRIVGRQAIFHLSIVRRTWTEHSLHDRFDVSWGIIYSVLSEQGRRIAELWRN